MVALQLEEFLPKFETTCHCYITGGEMILHCCEDFGTVFLRVLFISKKVEDGTCLQGFSQF